MKKADCIFSCTQPQLALAGLTPYANFSALGDFLTDWIIGCSTLAYANHGTRTTTSATFVVG